MKNNGWLIGTLKRIQHGEPLYYVLFVAGIIFFCFFYVSIIFNPERSGRQHAQVRRVHSGHPAGHEHGRLHEQHSDQDHGGGRHCTCRSCA